MKILTEKEQTRVAYLRGEIFEIIKTSVHIANLKHVLGSYVPSNNVFQRLVLLSLQNKLQDELVARLAELSKIPGGRDEKARRKNILQSTTFYSIRYVAIITTKRFMRLEKTFRAFVHQKKFVAKRNTQISHREFPKTLSKFFDIQISPKDVQWAIDYAVTIMQYIDTVLFGRRSIHFWNNSLNNLPKDLGMPGIIHSMLFAYSGLSKQARLEIFKYDVKQKRANLIRYYPSGLCLEESLGIIVYPNGHIKVAEGYPILQQNVQITRI